MADKYRNFAALAGAERAGIDYDIRLRRAQPSFAIVAPHGGGIEPGTSEIADAIADETFSFYTFEGIKSQGNADLHITSTHFDEPMCLTVLANTEVVVTIHGEESDDEGAGVFVGGLDQPLGDRIRDELSDAGFDASRHPDPDLQGIEACNIVNRGLSGAGVQLELSRSVRQTMFESLTKAGRKKTTERFTRFVEAVRTALAGPTS
jgi:phage replication-related protein YjqB (UPF0714/DUF867 family)